MARPPPRKKIEDLVKDEVERVVREELKELSLEIKQFNRRAKTLLQQLRQNIN